jgi:enhancer of polycomb-like protein
LQSILKGAGVSTSNEIPVPPPESSSLNYDELYATPFQEPNSYLRFSQTVEECIGCQYDLTEEDDAFLKSYNQKRAPSAQLSEDDMERILEVFEDTAYIKAPYAAIDQTIVQYDEMIAGLQQLNNPKVMHHAKELYEYWKARRVAVGNRSLHPSLKFETHQDSDELDPYVCFRRREVRQTRKTRQRDVMSAEKLKRLRKELEDGRQLIMASHDRETLKKEMLMTDRAIFEQRTALKELIQRLKIRNGDEDLINQKVGFQIQDVVHGSLLTSCSRKRERQSSLRLHGLHLQRSSVSTLLATLADLLSSTSHNWQINCKRGSLSCAEISR